MKKNRNKEFFDEFEITSDKKTEDWIYSFSDLITVLLCFFILFFVLKMKSEESLVVSDFKTINQEQVVANVAQEIEGLNNSEAVQVNSLSKFIKVTLWTDQFREGDQLSLDLRYQLTEFSEKVFTFFPKIKINISSAKMQTSQTSEEEAVNKAFQVKKYLVSLGLPSELISISSHVLRREPASEKQEVILSIFKNEE